MNNAPTSKAFRAWARLRRLNVYRYLCIPQSLFGCLLGLSLNWSYIFYMYIVSVPPGDGEHALSNCRALTVTPFVI